MYPGEQVTMLVKRKIAIIVVDDNPGFRHELVSIIGTLEYVHKAQGMGAENADVIANVLVGATDTVLIADYDALQRATDGTADQWIRATTARIEDDANVRIVVLAKDSDEILAVQMIKAGAADYMPKRLVSGQLVRKCLNQFVSEKEERPRVRRGSIRKVQRSKPQPLEVVVDGYEVRRKLYESRVSEIHLAHSIALDMPVVLKVLSKHTNNETELLRFKREYDTIKRLGESCVASVYEYGETETFAYIALEHFEQGSLKDRLANALTRTEAVEYLREIATSLQPVHALKIVHRDLKPSNIMLRDDGSVALIDFGIVKEVGEGTGLTKGGELRGSPYYMSPEQASGTDIDCRSDIYSLGVVFYEMLTGQKPYVGNDLMEVLSQHIEAAPPTLPRSLEGYQPLIDYMMAKDRGERMSRIELLLADPVLQQPDNPNPYALSRRA